MNARDAERVKGYVEARDYIFQTYKGIEQLCMPCIAADCGARTNTISLSNATYFPNGDSVFIPGEHRVTSWLHAWLQGKGKESSSREGITSGGTLAISRQERSTQSGFEFNGAYSDGAFPSIRVPVAIAASRAEFTFISTHYAKITDGEGYVGKVQRHTVELQKALICIGGVESGRDSSKDLQAAGFGIFTLHPGVFPSNRCYTIEQFLNEFGRDQAGYMNGAVRHLGGNLRIAFIGEIWPKS
ncbi:hypothetical protein HYU13_05080 [Candidatus Woesearchaeota archaeon]|nr:hypothetical protein [Candidatus Woesearchaeota archaeon]